MRRLIWGFTGRTNHIVGNLILQLKFICNAEFNSDMKTMPCYNNINLLGSTSIILREKKHGLQTKIQTRNQGQIGFLLFNDS